MGFKPRQELTERQEVEAWMVYFLIYGEIPEDDPEIDKFLAWEIKSHANIQCRFWSEISARILKEFIKDHPCTRPWAWWQYDAPRWDRKFDASFDGALAEPRRRIGGTGDPAFQHLAVVPHFDFGIPSTFINEFQETYYNGRALDIHGAVIDTSYKDGDFQGKAIDSDDPPVYESQANYLKRHGLLTEFEKQHVKKHPALLKPEKILNEGGTKCDF